MVTPRITRVSGLLFSILGMASIHSHAQVASCDVQLSAGSTVLGVPALSNSPVMGWDCSCAGDTSVESGVCKSIGYPNGMCGQGVASGTKGCRYGIRYQCVEFIRRFYSLRSDTINQLDTRSWFGPNFAKAEYFLSDDGISPLPSTQFTPVLNKAGASPSPAVGDTIVFHGGDDGHVAIVSAVHFNSLGTLTSIDLVEQNFTNSGMYTLTVFSDGTIGDVVNGKPTKTRGTFAIAGWLHEITSTAAQPPTSPQQPPVMGILTSTPSQPIVGNFLISITQGANYDTKAAQLYLTGPGCPCTILFKDLQILTPTSISGMAAINNSGPYDVYVQNGVNGPLSAAARINVNPAQGMNPQPSIAKLSPQSINIGDVTHISITGSGFIQATAVSLNGLPHAGTYMSPTSMDMPLTFPDVASAGSYPVVVANPVPGGGPSKQSYLQVNVPTPGQRPEITLLATVYQPTDAGNFDMHISGTNFETGDVQVFVTGPNCPQATSCVISHGVLNSVTTSSFVAPATIDSTGDFYVSAQNGQNGIASASPYHLHVNPPATINTISTDVNPPKVAMQFHMYIKASDVDADNVQVYVIGGQHCPQSNPCIIPHGAIANTHQNPMDVPATINDPGTFYVYVQNNPHAVPSNGWQISVSP